MKFRRENIEEFKALFYEIKASIEGQPGCHSVELMIDINDESRMFTYSIWDSESLLDAYRDSEIFKKVWPKTKSFLAEKPEAWTLVYDK